MKTALVTGSSRGIGKAIAIKLAQQNFKVVVTGRNQSEVEATCLELNKINPGCVPFVADLTSQDGLSNALKFVQSQFSQLDLLVTNIGSGKTPNEIVVDVDEWKRVFEINFFSAVAAVNTFFPLIEKVQGQIICISSIAGIENINAPASYSVAKAALIAYVTNLMRPLSQKNIRINCVSPGNVWIENGSWFNKMNQNPQRVNDIIQNQVALKKFVKPEEIADSVYFISQNESLTGQNIIVDAGQTRQT